MNLAIVRPVTFALIIEKWNYACFLICKWNAACPERTATAARGASPVPEADSLKGK